MNDRFICNREHAKLMGVAAGISDLTGADVLLVRLAIILAVLVTGPIAAILYVAAGLLAAKR
jgi:phage shock protein PspC (stress-responsive transcriptional regulator)